MTHDIGISMREIINHPCLSDAKLIGGANGLERIVKSVNVMEVPDILDWVKGGELLLTTVYAIREDMGAQSRFIAELAAKNLAGVAIKPGRYIDKVPDVMVRQANEHNLPLIELPVTIFWGDVINPVVSEIINKQAIILQRADEVHAKLSHVVLEGGDLPEIANALSELLNNNLVLIEPYMECAVFAPTAMQESIQSIEVLPHKNQENEILHPTSRGRAILDGRQVNYVRTLICAGKKHYGTITVFETKQQISQRDELTVERAVSITALAIVNRLAVTNVERHYYNEFINELLEAAPAEERQVRQRAKGLGVNLAKKYIAIVAHFDKADQVLADGPETADPGLEEIRQLTLQQLHRALRSRFPQLVVGYKIDSLIVFIPEPNAAHDKLAGAFRETIQEIRDFIMDNTNAVDPMATVWIGIGRAGSGLSGMQTSYWEAVQAYQIGSKVWSHEDTYYYNELGVWRLLGSMTDKDELRAFVAETVGPIVDYDKKKGTEMIRTLEIYFECCGNLKKVADRMFTHYNTVLYRLERIAQIAGVDLNDPTDQFNLRVGLNVLKIVDS